MKHIAQKSIFDGIETRVVKYRGYDCQLPVFYYGKRALAGVFLASAKKIKEKSPDKDFQPLEILPGVAAVAIIAFDFGSSIGPVNEFYVGIPEKQRGLLPYGLASLQEIVKGYMPAWNMHLPVSTDIAYQCGVEGWNFPKTLAEIPITDESGGIMKAEVRYDGKLACRLTGKKKAGKINYRITAQNVLLHKGGRGVCDHLFNMEGLSLSLLRKVRLETFSDAAIAKDLDDILLSKKSLISLYIPKVQAVLHTLD